VSREQEANLECAGRVPIYRGRDAEEKIKKAGDPRKSPALSQLVSLFEKRGQVRSGSIWRVTVCCKYFCN